MTSITLPLLIEAMAARAWLLVARQRGFQNLILECDSLQIMATFWDTSPFLSEVGNVVENSRVFPTPMSVAKPMALPTA
ncbi:unnamed protein product [Malus baccata var. baccata]